MDNKERLVQDWWDTLGYMEQQEVLSNIYPDEYIDDEDSMWQRLDLNRQWEIYKEWTE